MPEIIIDLGLVSVPLREEIANNIVGMLDEDDIKNLTIDNPPEDIDEDASS